jgi:transcriptional regulator GlxA family with amidase domain
MKRISILVPKKAILGSLEGTRMIFSQVNQFFQMRGAPALFDVQLVGLSKETPLSGGAFTANAHKLITEVDETDLIVIPAVDGDIAEAVEANKEFIPWIIKQYKNGAEIASLCMGAFILAKTGLLDGKKCSTHWIAANDFRKMYPDVELVDDKIVTEEQGIYSSGGAFSYLNLILHLVEKYAGREMAILASKVFAIEMGRSTQTAFTIFQGQKDHEDEEVKKAQEFIEEHYTDKLTVDQLAKMFYIGRRTFERRFKKATTNTIIEYIQRVKIEAAKKMLESSRENVNEVMYNVGYSDSKAFRNTFKKVVGYSPLEYRKKYNNEAVYV